MNPVTKNAVVNKNAVDYINKYERQRTLTYFKDYEKLVGISVGCLEEALKEIELDFSRYSQCITDSEIAKLYAPDVPEDRPLNNTFGKFDDIEHVVAIRLQAASYVNQGRLDKAYPTLESSASLVAALAYELCVRRRAIESDDEEFF